MSPVIGRDYAAGSNQYRRLDRLYDVALYLARNTRGWGGVRCCARWYSRNFLRINSIEG